jgi:hypothetical protein
MYTVCDGKLGHPRIGPIYVDDGFFRSIYVDDGIFSHPHVVLLRHAGSFKSVEKECLYQTDLVSSPPKPLSVLVDDPEIFGPDPDPTF